MDSLSVRSSVTKFEAITGFEVLSELAALSASDDFKIVDALEVFPDVALNCAGVSGTTSSWSVGT